MFFLALTLHGALFGQTYWSRSVQGNVYHEPIRPCLLPSGTLVLCGVDSLSDASLRDIVLTAIDTLGTLRWTQTIGTDYNDVPKEVLALSGGGVAVTGQVEIVDVSHRCFSDILCAGFTNAGDRVWLKRFAGPGEY